MLLLIPVVVMSFALLYVPLRLTLRNQWSLASSLAATLTAAAVVVFVVISAQRADANRGGGAEGLLGTDVPGLLVPPVLLGVLAVLVGKRRGRAA